MTAAKGAKVFDLDAWVPDPDEVKEPFVFKLDGKEFVLNDPRDETDWQDLVDAGPVTVFYQMLGDQAEEFTKIKLKTRKFTALTEAFSRHFGFVGPDGKAAVPGR